MANCFVNSVASQELHQACVGCNKALQVRHSAADVGLDASEEDCNWYAQGALAQTAIILRSEHGIWHDDRLFSSLSPNCN